ncbi:AraC family transcriptional regulator [Anoxybacillus rupiensis]|jgi:YesN/AraC family two-component response regulator|uniref:AraC family transcriptional regulator n=1 Tax=Anoxybacteroides rupiense TaxID=311460 RepID=A0ABT5W793_9BACL|nr:MULTISPECIES: AraC family transcriptional regulator [Anoxybacillus]MBS2770537.1 helix-turn-helix transcriptional regulator [Anoxybacillus rupiensis]MDE8565200.1 AraC family transcriptional regulator [Anoxybacillus rupiensis]OQM46563.1 AraC family transcriptional regulator [Anoxybacillus sp. UARK-01]QHC03204.1 helix-turn-helix domain-containing protein [Anoxybacillus sp. PDR2]
MRHIAFRCPPFPTFIKGGEAMFVQGKKHFKRTFSVFDLLYVKRGCLFMAEEDQLFEVKEGTYMILIPQREHYGYRPCVEDTLFVWLHFTMEQHYEILPKGEITWHDVMEREASYVEAAQYQFYLPQFGVMKHKERMEQLLEQVVHLEHDGSPDRALKQQIYFAEFLMQLQKQALDIPTASEKVCAEAVQYIHKHYREPFEMKKLARSLRFHPDYITRCMQKTMGMSVMQYLHYYRIAQAKKQLAETNDTIDSIAKRVGIEDAAYFSRLFKKVEGVTPTEYRRIVYRI